MFPDRLRFLPLLFFFLEDGLLAEEDAASVEGSKGVLLVTETTSVTFGGIFVWDCWIVESGLDADLDTDPLDVFLLSFKSDLICSSRFPSWNSDSSL